MSGLQGAAFARELARRAISVSEMGEHSETKQEMLASFERDGWVLADRASNRATWTITEKGDRVLADLLRVDAVMQDTGWDCEQARR